MGPESITGISIVSADSLDEAAKMAKSNPYVSSFRGERRDPRLLASGSNTAQ
jgi:hypothetical protein